MSIQLLKKLPTPTEIKADYPVTQKVAQITKRQFVNISTVCPGYRKKWQIS